MRAVERDAALAPSLRAHGNVVTPYWCLLIRARAGTILVDTGLATLAAA